MVRTYNVNMKMDDGSEVPMVVDAIVKDSGQVIVLRAVGWETGIDIPGLGRVEKAMDGELIRTDDGTWSKGERTRLYDKLRGARVQWL